MRPNRTVSSFNQAREVFMAQEHHRFWLGQQKRFRCKVLHIKKAFERTLWIMGRRVTHDGNTTLNYEYLWTFGEISCWKSLKDSESLLKLYLCQAKTQNASILKLLPNVLESDINSLISKIEHCPNYWLDDDKDFEIEQNIFNHFLFFEISKYFQQAMFFKVLSFNRKANTPPQQHTTSKLNW